MPVSGPGMLKTCRHKLNYDLICEDPLMPKDITEKDWKIFREVQTHALDRFCARILAEITRIAKDTSTSNHERYLLIYQLVQDRNAEIAAAFNDFRRSTALIQL